LPALPGLADAPLIAEQARTFWDDRWSIAFSELLILAHRGGCLLESELDPFLDHLDALASQPAGQLRLATESAEEAEALRNRLRRLQRDPDLRQRYVQLMRSAWTHIEPTWRSVGQATVLRTVLATRERLQRGTSVGDLLPPTHIVRRQRRAELLVLLNEAAEHGNVAVSPIYFTTSGAHILDLPGLVHVGMPVEDQDPRQQLAHLAEHVARRLKVLSDPTRVALLADLVRRPASITELAERFDLAQPTVSMHIKLLREAELLLHAKNGSRTTYSVDRERLECLFDDVQAALLPPPGQVAEFCDTSDRAIGRRVTGP
jgi:ArsR family transcriptional regulator